MLQRKLKQAVEPSLGSEELAEALQVLSGFYTTNTLANRRALRSSVETRALALNKRLLCAFTKLEARADVLHLASRFSAGTLKPHWAYSRLR